jgi:Nuclease-related domain
VTVGVLVPEDFSLRSLANDEERVVVEALRDRLSDDWLVIPDVGLVTDRRDRQIDVVIAHPREGVAVIEVKGHRVQLRHGQFVPDRGHLPVQPHVQARDNAYALRDWLRAAVPELSGLKVEYGVVFPNTTDRRGDLPPELKPVQFMTSTFLDDPADAIDRLMCLRWGGQDIGVDGLGAVARALRPDCELDCDDAARARRARQRMDELCEQRVAALEPLDVNRRVLVTGGAGSGKTRLASAWARRALGRGDRVLLTCYNDPLGDILVERFPPNDLLAVGPFYDVVRRLDGMPALEVPAEADGRWWETVAVGHLHSHWPSITERFDVVIVDEAQDFSPAWLAQLEQLGSPGHGRLMLLADAAQHVFPRGFDPQRLDESWTRCELVDNCRNTFDIASILHRRLDGAAPLAGPESLAVRWREATDDESVVGLVGEEIDHIETEVTRRRRS